MAAVELNTKAGAKPANDSVAFLRNGSKTILDDKEDLDLTKRVWVPNKEVGFRLMAIDGRKGDQLILRDETTGDVRQKNLQKKRRTQKRGEKGKRNAFDT